MSINAGDTAWLLVSAALVLFMTIGLTFLFRSTANVRTEGRSGEKNRGDYQRRKAGTG